MKTTSSSTNSLIFHEYSLDTPIGKLIIWLDTQNILQFTGWPEYRTETLAQLKRYYKVQEISLQPNPKKNTVVQAIDNYFKGDIKAINSLVIANFGTDFQRKVWQALRTIPAGEAISYGELARQIGKPLASRAVGMANHCNPIAIVVPCHRVIGKNNKLTGYAGGLDRKQWLLNHESCQSPLKLFP